MRTITIRLSDDMHYQLKQLVLEQSKEQKDQKVTLQSVILHQLHKLVPNAKLEDEE